MEEMKMIVNAQITWILAAIFACALIVFYYIRFYRPVKANCWFCNNNSYISREQLDWWFCTYCEQYNGFTEDGDYKKPIPAQQKLSHADYTLKTPDLNSSKFRNPLCDNCNRKEELKLRKRRELESNGIDSQSNIKKYIDSFEKKYPLCRTCDFNVQQTLKSQFQWLTENKMMSFRERSITMLTKNTRNWELFLRSFLTILNVALSFESTVWPSLIGGFFLQLISSRRTISGPFLIVFWICMIGLTLYPEIEFLKVLLTNKYFSVQDLSSLHIIMALRVVLGLKNMMPNSKSKPKCEASFKRLEISQEKPFRNLDWSLENNNVSSETCMSPVNITNSPPSFSTVKAPIAMKPQASRDYMFSTPSSLYKMNTAPAFGTYSIVSNSGYRSNKPPSKLPQNSCVDRLSTLSIADSRESRRQRPNHAFSTKSYRSSVPELFKRQSFSKKNVLAPPKFQPRTSFDSLTNVKEALSRSSSQSSGFSSVDSAETFEQDRASIFTPEFNESVNRLRNSGQRDFQYEDYSVKSLPRFDNCYSSFGEQAKFENFGLKEETPKMRKQILVTIGVSAAIYCTLTVCTFLVFKYLP